MYLSFCMLFTCFIIGFYILGYSLCYFWFRAIIRERKQGPWILMEKIIAITLSALSWTAIAGALLLLLFGQIFKIDFDKECKW